LIIIDGSDIGRKLRLLALFSGMRLDLTDEEEVALFKELNPDPPSSFKNAPTRISSGRDGRTPTTLV
jgi:hypothetical protein